MAIQTAIDQPIVQTKLEDEALAAQRAAEGLTHPQQRAPLTELIAVGDSELAHPSRAAEAVPRSTIVFVTTTTLAAAALFGYGLVSSRAMPALRRLVVNAVDVRVPILLPVTLAEIAWEILTDRRTVSSAAGRAPSR